MDRRLVDEPIGRFKAQLLRKPGVTAASLDTIARAMREEVDAAYDDARDAQYPDASTAFDDVQDVGDPRQEAY